jgi:histidine triad (HIT) family protein
MEDCIFCKIVKGKIPSAKIYENDKILAFLDISPVNRGHTLVIPKEHHKDLFDLPDELAKEVMIGLKTVADAVNKGVAADGLNIGLSNGEAAGQVVKHVHFHIMPRFKDDGLRLWPGKEYAEGEMEAVRKKIVDSIQ